MYKPATLLSIVIITTGLPAFSQGEADAVAKKRIAMVLPKAPANGGTVKTVPVPASPAQKLAEPVSTIEPATEFGSRARKDKEIPDSFKAAIIEGAEHLEVLSRSYNQRIADFILWILASMKNNPTITPHASPYFKPFVPVEHKTVPGIRSAQAVFQID